MKLLLLLLTGCYMHVAPTALNLGQQEQSVVLVDSECGEIHKQGTGVLISSKHVLTAAHVVACADLPTVTVTLAGGERRRFVVEMDDLLFGSGKDLARLQVMSSERLAGVPPLTARANGYVNVTTQHGHVLGYLKGTRVYATGIKLGDSGSPVYQAGALVGIVTATYSDGKRQVGAEIELVTSRWIP